MPRDRQAEISSKHSINRKHVARIAIDHDLDVVIVAIHAPYDNDMASADDVIHILHAVAPRYAYGLALTDAHVTRRRLDAGIDAYATGADLNTL